MKLPSFEEQWVLYQVMVLHADTPPDERVRLCLAFYGGIEVVLQYMRHIVSLDELDEAQAAFDAMYEESDAFFEMMRSKREPREQQ